MEAGASVWVKDSDESWISSTVISKIEDGGTFKITVSHQSCKAREFICRLDHDGELDGIKLQNDPSEATVENLINLPYLHEPAILHCLQNRYICGDIYTYTGPILIALNPFKSVPLYTPQILESYYNFGLLKSQGIDSGRPLSPHVYAVADASYRDMMRVISQNAVTKTVAAVNQTILISGESGAGKTESTKIVLRYLTTVGNTSGNTALATGSVMDKVLQSNPILESFGNAKTLRNDNSSRFGKFIELHFSKRGHLIGGTIRTYLLEKVRLAAQQHGERSFHIMYQLIAGCSQAEKADWQLTSAQDYWYCNQGSVFTLQSVNDAEEFTDLRMALSTLNFEEKDQRALFGSIAGLLHLSEVTFTASKIAEEGCAVSATEIVQTHIAAVARLCGIAVEQLERVLTVRVITAKDESYEIQLTPGQAVDARDALSKALYSRLFEWIVSRVNESIRVEESDRVRAEIGVLDIFGFESFLTNSFEQLCINYTNETLQQQFNQFVFKLEQSEYQREEISWSFIEFPDNQDCLDLIEHRQNGILAVLDDVCKLPQASDEKFANRLYKMLETNPRFSATMGQKRDLIFCVTHYAGPVEYLSTSFVEKNKNELPKEAIHLFQQSTLPLLSTIFCDAWSPSGPEEKDSVVATVGNGGSHSHHGAGGGKVASVSTQFKSQLAQLMEKVSSTMPHYIRCLKPNDQSMADKFDRKRTTEQLRYGGVLEAVRVARSGFPVRLTHSDFYSRYRCVANPFNALTARLPPSIENINIYIARRETLLGESRSLSVGVSASRRGSIEKEPDSCCRSLVLTLLDQEVSSSSDKNELDKRSRDGSLWMGVSTSSTATARVTSAVSQDSIQCGLTKVFLRKSAHDMLEGRRSRRQRAAAGKIQSFYRTYLVRTRYLSMLRAVGLIQRAVRGSAARKKARELKRNKAASKLQNKWRSAVARGQYTKFHHSVVALQSRCRGKAARLHFISLLLYRNTVRLQRILRGATKQRKWRKLRRAIVALQCVLRCSRAKVALKVLKAAAKDVGKLQLNNEALKLEIEQLRARAKDETRRVLLETEERSAVAAQEEMAALRLELANARSELEAERLISKKVSKELSASQLEEQRATALVTDLKAQLKEQRELADKELKKTVTASEEEVAMLRLALKNLSERLENPLTSEHPAENGLLKKLSRPVNAVSAVTSTAIMKGFDSDSTLSSSMSSSATTSDDMPVEKVPKVTSASAVATFERNLVTLRSKLRQGIKVHLWEEGPSSHVHSFECLLTLDRTYEALLFTAAAHRRGTFSMFTQKVEVEPIRIKDIDDCSQGAAHMSDLSLFSVLGLSGQIGSPEENAMDTLTIKVGAKGMDEESARVVSLRLVNREARDFLLSAMRTMISDLHVSRGKMGSISPTPKKPKPISLCVPVSPIRNKESKKDGEGEDKVCDLDSEHKIKEKERSSVDTNAELQRQLLTERSNFDRVMLQIFALTNDLNEKDDTIVKLKRREASLERMVFVNEKVHEQDALVRLQLGKRLEQVLLDKEEAYEELEQLQSKLATIKTAMAIMDYSKASAAVSTPVRR